MTTPLPSLIVAILLVAAAAHWGVWAVLATLAVFCVVLAVLLAVLAIANNRFFDAAQRKAAESYRRETEAQRVKALREIGRLKAHTNRSLPEKALFGRN
jgi:membrane protein implicated in regulation of membrane protease activity